MNPFTVGLKPEQAFDPRAMQALGFLSVHDSRASAEVQSSAFLNSPDHAVTKPLTELEQAKTVNNKMTEAKFRRLVPCKLASIGKITYAGTSTRDPTRWDTLMPIRAVMHRTATTSKNKTATPAARRTCGGLTWK